jgi:hypothetical protein
VNNKFGAFGDVKYFITEISHRCFNGLNTSPLLHDTHDLPSISKYGLSGRHVMQVVPLKKGATFGHIAFRLSGINESLPIIY